MDRKEGEFKVGDRVEVLLGVWEGRLGAVAKDAKSSGHHNVLVQFRDDNYGPRSSLRFGRSNLRLVSAQCDNPQPLGASWPKDDGRIDAIGQNGNGGEHYEALDRLQIEADFNDDIPAGAQPVPLSVCELQAAVAPTAVPEHTGLSVGYYSAVISNPTTAGRAPYVAECNDIIEALGMTYAEGNVFKAVWRRCAARTLGKHKQGNDPLYDAEKTLFFAGRILAQEKAK